MTLRKTVEKLSESRMRAIVLWPTDHPYIIRDTGVRGLLLRKGLKRTSWHFYDETRIGHGERSYTSRVLGDASKMTLAQARKQARKIAGRMPQIAVSQENAKPSVLRPRLPTISSTCKSARQIVASPPVGPQTSRGWQLTSCRNGANGRSLK